MYRMKQYAKSPVVLTAILLFLCLSLSFNCQADDLRPAAIFNDNMVLQRNTEIKIWGQANPGATVTINFAQKKLSSVSDVNGNWAVFLPPFPECSSPQKMVIESGNKRKVFDNILIGDVWLASGQSNMLMRVNSLKKEDREAVMSIYDNEFRYTQITPVVEGGKTKVATQTGWESQHSENTRLWSAFSIYFAKELRRATNVPIGIICCAQGSSNIEAWIDKEFATRHSLTKHCGKDYPETHIYSNYKNTSSLFDSMLSRIIGYNIKGVIWYQGEANAKTGIAKSYSQLLTGLIHCWREKWNNPDLAFGIVQLPNYDYKEAPGGKDQSWAIVRQAQKEVCEKTPMSVMAVTIGLGEDGNIHPKNKEEAGKRMASEVLSGISGFGKYPTSPELGAPLLSGNKIIIPAQGLKKAAKIDGFEICTEGDTWRSVKAKVLRDRIVIQTDDSFSGITSVRYAWRNTARPTVLSRHGIPASPMLWTFQDSPGRVRHRKSS